MNRQITELLARCGEPGSVMPPTQLYNEGWMLRLVLDWFDRNRSLEHKLALLPKTRWYSEALLPSRFLRQPRDPDGTPFESFTHADGVIGHFKIEPGVQGHAVLCSEATQFIVCEAKLGSGLSPRTKNAPGYDQAARNVACMAYMLGMANVPVDQLKRLAFYVIAPRKQIENRMFGSLITLESVRAKVRARVAQYEDADMDQWYRTLFEPVLDKIDLGVLSWESILQALPESEEVAGMREFYAKCLAFNPLRAGKRAVNAGAPEMREEEPLKL